MATTNPHDTGNNGIFVCQCLTRLVTAAEILRGKCDECHKLRRGAPTCTAACAGSDAYTHTTAEHDENWHQTLEDCDSCGSKSGESCKPTCEYAYCPNCKVQNWECDCEDRVEITVYVPRNQISDRWDPR